MSGSDAGGAGDISIVYDGDCPFCNSFVMLYRIREHTRNLQLIDARTDHPILAEIRRHRFDLNEGMVVKFNGRFYHGAEAMNILAILGSGTSWFNRLNRALFRRPAAARLLYPLLVRGRLITLRLLHRPLIGEA